jgi:hypothetical protein
MSEDPGPLDAHTRGSRAADALVVSTALVGVAAAVTSGPAAEIAVALLALVLVAWPFGFLVFLARRWARIGDWRFVGMTAVLATMGVAATAIGIRLAG